ncbi:MAG: LicD family protein [Bacteroidales bacterium]|nr:LicD family protein [Bacteroidales bacterium]
MKYLTDTEIKQELFNLLCSFDSFASKIDVRYTLLGGTLLGAVRHKGFIPWDDDIDVGVPRPDYNKLIAHAHEAPKGTFISTLNEQMPFPFCKYCNETILCQEEFSALQQSLWVDVFPLDAMPDDNELWKVQFSQVQKLKAKAGLRISVPTNPVKKVVVKPVSALLNAIKQPLAFYKEIDVIAQKYEFGSTRRCRDTSWNWSPTNYFLTEDFEDLTEIEFCGRRFPAVSHWDETLTSMYGNYTVLPPIAKRESHKLKAWYKEG